MDIVSKFSDIKQRLGPSIVRRAVNRLLSVFYKNTEYTIVVFPLHRHSSAISNSSDIVIRQFEFSDIDRVRKQFGPDITSRFSQRLSSATGYVALDKEQIVGYFWSSTRPVEKEGLSSFRIDIQPKEGLVYFFDIFTLPQYRRKGVMMRIFDFALSEFQRAGLLKTFGMISTRNLQSLELMKKIGFEEAGTVRCRRIFGLERKDIVALYPFSA